MVTSAEFIEKMNAIDPDVTILEPVGGNSDAQMPEEPEKGEENEAPVEEPSGGPTAESLGSANEEGGGRDSGSPSGGR